MNVQEKTGDLPPFKPVPMKPARVELTKKPDGTLYLRSLYPLTNVPRSLAHVLQASAAAWPQRNFLAERALLADGRTGDWRFITYGETEVRARAVAQALLDKDMGAGTPLMILSGNSIRHAVMMLGAMKAGVPVVPVSVAYSLVSRDFAKLKHVFGTTRPKMIFAEDGPRFARAIEAIAGPNVAVVTDTPIPGRPTLSYDEVIATQPGGDVAAAMDKIDHGMAAKYIFTSGSTGMPKGVAQTHGMLCAQLGMSEALRAVDPDPDIVPVSLEWMPWSHISAGNVSFNRNMASGATIYLDAGKPVPGQFDETIRNLREVTPSVFSSAPVAYTWLADALEKDRAFRDQFFSKVHSLAYGGATLSQDIYERFQKMSIAATGYRTPITTMYGATETQGITVVHWLTERVGLIGVPLPGITLKLVPNGTKLEIRVKGPTVMPGYLDRPDLTKAAFDEEGFYCLGDAAKFVDENDPAKGLVFDGRVTEDFKLDSGTWVSVGTLRAHAIAAASPLIQDCIVCGHDKPYVALLAWPNMAAARDICADTVRTTDEELIHSPKVKDFVRQHFAAHNKQAGGSSSRVKRVMLMLEPPSIEAQEITDKGYVNQRATLERRAKLVELLYAATPPDDVIEIA